MTDNHNTNDDGMRPTPTPQDSSTSTSNGGTSSDDASWEAFARAHEDDLKDVERSRNARRFERHAQRKEKEALVSVEDLDASAFAGAGEPLGRRVRGPRDNTNSSWLDTDEVMDRYDNGGFTPPNPELGPVKASTALLTALLVIGVAGTVVMMLVPSLYGIPVVSALLNIAFGLCTVLGLGGLIVKALNRKDRPGDKGGFYDDGARV